jgi:hypothetical protein
MADKPPLESETQREILLAAPSMGARLLRNNVGQLTDARGGHVRYGVGGDGGSDLIGWMDLGSLAVFLAVEVKRRGKKPTDKQSAFLAAINAAGGLGIVAYSVDDVRREIDGFRAKRSGVVGRLQESGVEGYRGKAEAMDSVPTPG